MDSPAAAPAAAVQQVAVQQAAAQQAIQQAAAQQAAAPAVAAVQQAAAPAVAAVQQGAAPAAAVQQEQAPIDLQAINQVDGEIDEDLLFLTYTLMPLDEAAWVGARRILHPSQWEDLLE